MIIEFAKYKIQWTMEKVLKTLGKGVVTYDSLYIHSPNLKYFEPLLKKYLRWKLNLKRIKLERILPGNYINPQQEYIHVDFMSNGNHDFDIEDEDEFIEFINNPEITKEEMKITLQANKYNL